MTATEVCYSPVRLLMKIALALLVAAGGLTAVGYWPTLAWGGPGALRALWLGVGCALLASLVGVLPTIWTLRSEPRYRVAGALGSTALRIVLMLGLLAALLIGEAAPRVPLALWAVCAYILLLVVDTVIVTMLGRQMERAS